MDSSQILSRAVRTALYAGGALAVGFGPSAMAQQQPGGKAAGEEAGLGEVVVTGSRIAQPNIDAISPVTAITAAEIKQTGTTRVEDLLNALPQVMADQGSGISMNSTGTATVDLRGLGVQRTLVLVNGRRLMPGDPYNQGNPGYASAADLNQIPVALVERVDVLTGGASATYGADAVAGVVNFLMNDHFEGVRVDANAGIYNHKDKEDWIQPVLAASGFPPASSTHWDGVSKDVTAIFGGNFADGKGNLTGYIGYRNASPVTGEQRDYGACVLANNTSAALTGKQHYPYVCGGSSTTAPTAFRSPGGSFLTGAIGTGTWSPDASGNVSPGYNLFNYGPTHYFQRSDERYTGGLYGHLKVADHAEVYTEFSFMRDDTSGRYAPAGAFRGGGTVVDPVTGGTSGLFGVNCGPVGGTYGNAGMNPFLSLQEFNAICTAGTNGLNGAGNTVISYMSNAIPAGHGSAGFILGNGDAALSLGRRNVEGGPRDDFYTHVSNRGVIGVKGDFADVWKYDAYIQSGTTSFQDYHINDVSTQRLQDALYAVKDASGNVVCRSGNVGCSPWNIFGTGTGVSQAALTWIGVPGILTGSTTERIASGYVSGDLGKKGITTPWAKDGLQVVFGSEYRQEQLTLHPDIEWLTGDLAGSGLPTPPVDAEIHLWELFTEAHLPLVQDAPMMKALNVEAGYRYSDYTLGFNTNTYKLGLEWTPVSSIRFRASYNRAVRAPNINELYQPDHLSLENFSDPCATGAPTASAAACALMGVSGAEYGNIPKNPAAQYNAINGGTTSLKPEVGTTQSFGFVFTPAAIPEFFATVDYADIKISDLIQGYGAATIIGNCIASNSATSTWCELVHRDSNGSLWLSQNGYVTDVTLNAGAEETKVIDVSMVYRLNMGSAGDMHFRLDGTYLQSFVFSPVQAPSYDCKGYFGAVCGVPLPTWRHRFQADWVSPFQVRNLSVGAIWRHFDGTRLDLDSQTNPNYIANNRFSDDHLPSMNYLDLHATYNWDKVSLTVGINNVLDKDPPLVGGSELPFLSDNNTFPTMYDSLGRYLFAHVTIDF
jgi:iron complex outermembrane recepter protein